MLFNEFAQKVEVLARRPYSFTAASAFLHSLQGRIPVGECCLVPRRAVDALRACTYLLPWESI